MLSDVCPTWSYSPKLSLSGFRINYNVRAHHIKEIRHQMQQCYVFSFNSFYAPYYVL